MEVTVKLRIDVDEFTAMRLRRLHEKYPHAEVPVIDPLVRGWFLSALLVPTVFDQGEPPTTSAEDPPRTRKANGS